MPPTALEFSSSRISFKEGGLVPRRGAGPLYSHETADVRHGLGTLTGDPGFERAIPS